MNEEPLSLDDDVPLPVAARPKRSPLRTAVFTFLSLLVTIVLMGAIYGAFRYGNADIPESAWSAFAPPGETCSIRMPGEPTGEAIAAEGFASQGGRRFTKHRRFEQVDVDFGWIDFDATRATERRFDAIVAGLRDREIKRLDGKLTGESRVNYVVKNRKYEVRQYLIDLPQGKAVMQIYFDPDTERLKFHTATSVQLETLVLDIPTGWDLRGPPLAIEIPVEVRRMVVEPGQSLRLFFAVAGGGNVTRETPWVPKFLGSLLPE